MARKTSIGLLEQKISIAQEKVSKAKKRYDAATSNLQKLLDKREALRNEELLLRTFLTNLERLMAVS